MQSVFNFLVRCTDRLVRFSAALHSQTIILRRKYEQNRLTRTARNTEKAHSTLMGMRAHYEAMLDAEQEERLQCSSLHKVDDRTLSYLQDLRELGCGSLALEQTLPGPQVIRKPVNGG